MKKIAVILSGCGHMDGSEIRETVLTLLYLDMAGAQADIFAPDTQQHHTLNHLTGEEEPHPRSALSEAARLARGNIRPLDTLNPADYDGLILPGGYGVAKNLSDFAFNGAQIQVLPLLHDIVSRFYAQAKPIGAICIAPVVLAAVLKDRSINLTIGDDQDTAFVIHSFGNQHKIANASEAVIDEQHRIATCPAYMKADAPISEIAKGIEKVIKAVVEMISAKEERIAS